jgi:hypothetical protein
MNHLSGSNYSNDNVPIKITKNSIKLIFIQKRLKQTKIISKSNKDKWEKAG